MQTGSRGSKPSPEDEARNTETHMPPAQALEELMQIKISFAWRTSTSYQSLPCAAKTLVFVPKNNTFQPIAYSSTPVESGD